MLERWSGSRFIISFDKNIIVEVRNKGRLMLSIPQIVNLVYYILFFIHY